MKILVIGNGLIGSQIVERLVDEGNELLVFSRSYNQKTKCKQVIGDIFDFEKFEIVLAWKPEIIIHTAWVTNPRVYRDDPSNLKYSDFITKLVGRIANSNLEHLIVLGSCAEYGRRAHPSTAGITNLSPISLYAKQKVNTFYETQKTCQEVGLKFTWARIFFPYGPNQNSERLVPYLINSLKNGDPIQLTDISSLHDWITTRDIASAISWILSHELPVELDVGTSLATTNLQILATIEDLLNTKNRLSTDMKHQHGFEDVFVAGIDTPLLTSGWSPADTFESGLDWVINS